MSVSGKRIPYVVIGFVSLLAIISSLLPAHTVLADQILTRSLTLEDGTVPGSSPGDGNAADTVNHLFTFTLPSGGGTVHSISFQYCTTADIDVTGGTCTTPTGLVTTAATLGSNSSASFDGITATANGVPYVTNTTGITGDGTTSYKVELDGIQNPDNTNCGGVAPASNNCTFYVRITTYTGADGSTGPVDAGTVAASTTTAIVLTGTMPESLIFCTGATVTQNCTDSTSGNISFPMLFSPTATAYTTSQMAASTNGLEGYAISLEGTTLESGSNSIKAIGATAAASSIGSPQFGLNLVTNTTPAVGADITPVSNASSSLMANPATNFGTADSFAFDDTAANNIANSDFGNPGTSKPTDSQIYTVSYIVNVDGAQPAGTYKTTLTYICTPTF